MQSSDVASRRLMRDNLEEVLGGQPPANATVNPESELKAQRLECPVCSRRAKAVKAITIQSLVTDQARARVGRTEGFRFCAQPACDVAYFHPQSGDRYLRADVRVRIGQKETSPPRPVCYCFNHTVEEIEAEVARTGSSTILDEIAQKCRQGLDRCELTNPQGTCCLSNVQRAFKEAQAKFGKAPAAIAGSDEQVAEDPADCCTVDAMSDSAHDVRLRKLGLWSTGGAFVAAILASACCSLPLVLIAFGASAAGVSGFFEQYRFYFLAATGVLLAVSYYLVFFRKQSCDPASACAQPNHTLSRFNKVMLVVATVGILLFAFFPNYLGLLIGGASAGEVVTTTADDSRVIRIEGMTCAGCANALTARLRSLPGVANAQVDYDQAQANVTLSPQGTLKEVLQTIADLGFRGQIQD